MSVFVNCLKPVESSMFSRAGYDAASWSLVVEFKSTGEVRAYTNIDPAVADEWLTAKSLGGWWNQNVKGHPDDWPYTVLFTAREKTEKKNEPISLETPTSSASATAKAQAEKTEKEEVSAIDADWAAAEKTWTPPAGVPAEEMGLERHVADSYGGITRTASPEVASLPMQTFTPGPIVPTEVFEYANQVQSASEAITGASAFLLHEVLSPFPVPTTPIDAITILQDRQTEIAALIHANAEQAQAALAMQVTNAQQHTGAALIVRQLVEAKDRAESLLEPFRKILYDTYTVAGNYKKQALQALEGAIRTLNGRLTAWEQEQERIRLQKLREAQEAANAEAQRQQAAQSQQLTLLEMQEAIEVGDHQRAEDLLHTPIEVPTPYVAPAAVEPTYLPPAGQSVREAWKVDEEQVDLATFLRAVRDQKIELDIAAGYILPNYPALNSIAKGMRDKFNVPGFKVKKEVVRSTRRK